MSDVQTAPEQEVKPKKTRGKSGSPEAPASADGTPTKTRKVGARGSVKFSMDAKITLLVEKNPKQPQSKSYIRFEEYVNGMTCKEAIDKGVLLADLYYDSQHKFISIEGYEAPPLERKAKAPKAAETPATESVAAAA